MNRYMWVNGGAVFCVYNSCRWKSQHLSLLDCMSVLHRTGKGHFSIPKKGNAKECSNYRTIALISHASKVMLKHSINTWRHKHVQINILTYSLTWLIHVHRLAHIQSQICFKFTSCSHTWTCLHIQFHSGKIIIH